MRAARPDRVLVTTEHASGAYAARAVRGRARLFLDALKQPGELSVVITTDAAIQGLNKQWRKKNKPTDVLSFGQDPASGLLGDVVISLDTARRQAMEGKRPLTDELTRLLAHGVLHLMGHDHEQPDDARRMARAEVRLLKVAGLHVAGLVGAAHPAQLTFTRAPLDSGPRSPSRKRTRRTAGRTSERRT